MGKIVSLIDIPERDLNFNFLLKLLLENKGITLDIEHQDNLYMFSRGSYFDTINNRCDLLLTPAYNVGRTPSFLSRAYHTQAKLIHTHSEPLSETALLEEKLNLKYLMSYNRHIDFHIVWSDYFKKLLIEKAKVDESKIYRVNNIRYETIYQKSLQKPKKDIDLLLISDFTFADYGDEEINKHKKLYKLPKNIPLAENSKVARDNFVKLAQRLVELYPDWNIVVRLHPGEKEEFYRENLSSSLKKLTINNEGDITDLIIRSKIALGYTSTTFFECIAAGVKMYPVLFNDLPDFLDQEIYKLYPWITIDDLLEELRDFEKAKDSQYPSEMVSKWEYYTGLIRQNNASQNYALALEEILEVAKSKPSKNYTLSDKLKIFKVDFIELVKDLLIKISFLIKAYFKKNMLVYQRSEEMVKDVEVVDHLSLYKLFKEYKEQYVDKPK